MDRYSKVGVFISELRKSKGLSQSELGEILHVSKKAISRWETGRGLPDSSTLIPLSDALGVTVDEILRGELISPSDSDEESYERIRKMNAVFEYLAEKKLLNKTLMALLSVISINFIIAIIVEEKNSNLGAFSAATGSIFTSNNTIVLLSSVAFLFSLALYFYRLYRTVFAWIKIKQ